MQADELPAMMIAEVPRELRPTMVERVDVTWDAPDLVWAVGVLSAPEVVRGVVLSLLAGLLPCLFYVAALYWADRYEKEPVPLLATAFLWGAVPALLLSVSVRLFFRLPVDLLGPNAVEAVQAGLLTPLIEEALKGAVVLFIAWRYRFEFDNVLDGIIYGAMVGIGFAMTSNTLGYLVAFLLYGFDGLGSSVYVEGVLYGLNHALYTAIFGAGLGYARLARRRWKRWAIPLAAFVLAVAAHALHSLALRSAMGWNLLTVTVTWAGLLVMIVVMAWSLRRQRCCMATELIGEVPEDLYHTVLTPGERLRAQWRALSRQGLRGLGRMRRLHQQCAELAFKKMQLRRRPDEPRLREEVVRQRDTLRALVKEGYGAAAS
jgi:RsiW-degrading membrane proteinase PrsW (M82 family)